MRTAKRLWILAVQAALLAGNLPAAADWPQWRYDAARTAASSESLPAELHPQWTLQLPPLEPAWPDEPRQQFDGIYEPIVAGDRLFIASSANDSVSAYDARSGRLAWRFFAAGPVRFAPIAAMGRIYFGADDGSLYCLDAATGSLDWKQPIVPCSKRRIGHGRVVSRWPVSGGPVLADGILYCAAGVWPSEGVFCAAVDPEDGKFLWVNSGEGATYQLHPHDGALAFSGLTPQGYLTVSQDRLIVPCGRATPAVLDRRSGKLLYFRPTENEENGGGTVLVGSSQQFFSRGGVFDLNTGDLLADCREVPVLAPPLLFDGRGARDLTRQPSKAGFPHLWQLPVSDAEVHLKAGDRLYASRESEILAIDLPGANKGPVVSWRTSLPEHVARLVVARQQLYAVTCAGSIHCFGAEPREELATLPASNARTPSTKDDWTGRVADLLRRLPDDEGYCLVQGMGSERLIEELVRQSRLNILVIDPNPAAVDAQRRRFDAEMAYGRRVSLLSETADWSILPAFFANLVLSENLPAPSDGTNEAFAKGVLQTLRPYGGLACFFGPEERRTAIQAALRAVAASELEMETSAECLIVRRPGPLPEAAPWSHELSDAANSRASRDVRVRAPLAVLWYGGPAGGNLYFDRHVNPPSPLVVEGRMIVQGPESLAAIDVYTGRLLWREPLPASKTGFAYAATSDSVYVYCGSLLVLDAATGKRRDGLSFPPELAHFRIDGDLLVAASGQQLVACNRHSGERCWSFPLAESPRALAVGNDRVFCLAGPSAERIDAQRRRGESPTATCELICCGLHSGQLLWKRTAALHEFELAYSRRHDRLLVAGEHAVVSVLDGTNGEPCWRSTLGWPCMLLDDCLLSQDAAFEWQTGKPLQRSDLTGASIPLTFARTYGCNQAVASPHLVTFRSGTGGFFDLQNDGGTGNLGGFRTGCTNSLIAADGVLVAPKFAQGCACAYPLFSALAFVHDPEAELWTSNSFSTGTGRIGRVGINLGAPGDRRDDQGLLWLDVPSSGGPSPELCVTITPSTARPFRQHSLLLEGDRLKWVGASGIEGLRELRCQLVFEPSLGSSGIYVASGEDDAEENPDGTINLTSSDLELTQEEQRQIVGIRFQRVPLERDQALDEVHLQFTVDETSDEPTQLQIEAEAADDAPRFTESKYDVSRRPRTRAKIPWRVQPWRTVREAGELQCTPDLRPLLAEILQRPGWKAGNSLAFVITGEGKRVADSFNGGHTTGTATTAPRLVWRAAAPASYSSAVEPTEFDRPAKYTVELVFAEPQEIGPNARVFDVELQGATVLKNFDVVQEAGGPRRVLVKRFDGIPLTNELRLQLTPRIGLPILCGVRITMEDKSGT